jgi:hypothetical protein
MATNNHAQRLREYLELLARTESPQKAPSYHDWMSWGMGAAVVGLALSLTACSDDTEATNKESVGGAAGRVVGSGGSAGQDVDSSHGGTTWEESQGGTLAASGGMAPPYGIVMVENCADSIDNDRDGLLDCADEDCDSNPACSGTGGNTSTGGTTGHGGTTSVGGSQARGGATASGGRTGAGGDLALGGAMVPAYGIPMEANCTDGIDNDYDSDIDCADDDCTDAAECVGSGGNGGGAGDGGSGGDIAFGGAMGTEYGVFLFGGSADQGGGGGVSGDGGSAGHIALGGAMASDYGITMEQDCRDWVDNDDDGNVDCADPDCAMDETCGWGALYGVPSTPWSNSD